MARLGKDAELRFAPDGTAVCNLSLAVSYGKAQDGKRPTQWIEASLWGKQAEALAQYLTKGSMHCFALSDLHIETYQGQNGEGHKLVARVDSVELGPRMDAPQGAPQQPARPAPARNAYADAKGVPARPAAPARQAAQSYGVGSGFDSMDEDIPFASPWMEHDRAANNRKAARIRFAR
jgi:single-strand DNA-binding protein